MFIYSNLATSLDGKIATAARTPFWLGTAADRKLMVELRADADAVLFGASTLRTHGDYCAPPRATRKKHLPWNIVLSHHLEGVSARLPFFSFPGGKRLLCVARDISRKRLAAFDKTSEIFFLSSAQQRNPAPAIVRELKRRKMRRLLVEGGGGVMWSFASAHLIDEYYVTLTPRILGGTEAPTLVDGRGFTPAESLLLKLKSVRRVKDELFLVYRSRRR